MKIKRSKIKEWGSGSGKYIFESDFFEVVLWKMENGIRTVINIKYCNKKIILDGIHKFKSDKTCFEQLTIPELKYLIKGHSKQSFQAGRNNKVHEIKKIFRFDY